MRLIQSSQALAQLGQDRENAGVLGVVVQAVGLERIEGEVEELLGRHRGGVPQPRSTSRSLVAESSQLARTG